MDADVVVIGAGAAGLAAARKLAERALRVVLVEARARVGGRAWSRPLAGADGVVELGAEFIHGPAPETRALLREISMPAVASNGESWMRGDDGALRPSEDIFDAAAALFDGLSPSGPDQSVERYLQRFERDEATRRAAAGARMFVEGFDAADPAIASVQSIAEEWRSGVDATIARPRDGYGALFEHLRVRCVAAGVQLRCSEPVKKISWKRGEVEVESRGADGLSRVIRAPRAIVTLPAGVLRRRGEGTGVVFVPDLPESKHAAVQAIEMGHAVRVVLSFRAAFWRQAHDGRYRDGSFFRADGGSFGAFWARLSSRDAVVVAWAGGPRAIALQALSEEELSARALDEFGDLFGERATARREFVASATHDWSGDPLASGAYSYVAVGGGNAREVLAAPLEDTLFFAGEATAPNGEGGTVNGALVTGERAAAEAMLSAAAG